jgi:hypothetical protein
MSRIFVCNFIYERKVSDKLNLFASVMKQCSVKMYEGVEINLHLSELQHYGRWVINFPLPPLYPWISWGGISERVWTWYQESYPVMQLDVSPWKPLSTVCTESCGVKWIARLFHIQEVPGLEFCPGLVTLTEGCPDSTRGWLYWLKFGMILAGDWLCWMRVVLILPRGLVILTDLSWFCPGWLYWLRIVLILYGTGYTGWGLSWFYLGTGYADRFVLILPGAGYTDWSSSWLWPGIGYTGWGLFSFCPGDWLYWQICPDSVRDWLYWLRIVLILPGTGYTDSGRPDSARGLLY